MSAMPEVDVETMVQELQAQHMRDARRAAEFAGIVATLTKRNAELESENAALKERLGTQAAQ